MSKVALQFDETKEKKQFFKIDFILAKKVKINQIKL